jgi:hypothetical protein
MKGIAKGRFLVHPTEACAGRWKVVTPTSTGSSSLTPARSIEVLHDPRRTLGLNEGKHPNREEEPVLLLLLDFAMQSSVAYASAG